MCFYVLKVEDKEVVEAHYIPEDSVVIENTIPINEQAFEFIIKFE